MILSLENLRTEVSLKCKLKTHEGQITGKFWQENDSDGIIGAFQHGNGYRAYAEDFPEGTIIKITAEVILPKK